MYSTYLTCAYLTLPCLAGLPYPFHRGVLSYLPSPPPSSSAPPPRVASTITAKQLRDLLSTPPSHLSATQSTIAPRSPDALGRSESTGPADTSLMGAGGSCDCYTLSPAVSRCLPPGLSGGSDCNAAAREGMVYCHHVSGIEKRHFLLGSLLPLHGVDGLESIPAS